MVGTKKRKTIKPEELTPDEIRRIREGLGLSQVEAGELLGGGPRAFTKYESGTIRPAASVANILRLLEADPAALATLTGRKVAPIDSDGAKPLEVTGRHIAALSDRKLANLVRRLLAAEAQSGDLPMDGIHVAAVITAPDGGEDARIEWAGGPERTAFLPSRLSQFQFKATEISPKEAAADVLTSTGDIEPMVRSALEAGGTYIMLCSRAYTYEKVKKRAASILKALVDKGLKIEPTQIQFREASQIADWVNACPPVAAWVLEQTQPGLVGPFRDWTHWAARFEHGSSPWVHDPRLAPFRDELRKLVITTRGVARIVGLSGVGKSRLVLEALGPTEEEERFAPPLSDLVLYAIESESGSAAIKTVVQSLADASVRAIIVVDRCVTDTHQDLAAIVKRTGSRLSLVTIDHEIPSGPRPNGTLLVNRADEAVIDGLLKRMAPNLPSEDHRRLVKFSAGFPQMILLLGQAWLKDASIASAGDDELVDRIIFGRKPLDPTLLQDASMLLGAFGLLGTKQPLTDLEEVAPFARSRTADDLRAALDDLCKRGIVQRRGRLITLQPRPVALALAERQWRLWDTARWDAVLTGAVSEYLRRRAARQLALLNDRAIATEVVRHVCRLNGPLASLAGLSQEGNAEVLSSLAEVDTDVVISLLERLLTRLSESELKEISGDVRRHLVRALQKIAFVLATFEQGAMLLLKLAVAENENWGNNATGQFKALFPVFLADTEAGPDARLRILDELIAENSPPRMPLVVGALLEGATTNHYSRSVGSEVHGSRPAYEPWKPKLWKDAWDYIIACLDRLTKLGTRTDDIGHRARVGIGHKLRALVSHGLIEQAEKWVGEIIATHRYWPEALNALGHVLKYDKNGLESGVEQRVRKLITKLTPNDLTDRVRYLVTEMPWDFPDDEKLDFDKKRKRQIEAVDELVRDLLKEPETIGRLLPQLSVGLPRMAHAFGRALATYADKPLVWQEPVKTAVASVAEKERNFGLLAGYYSCLAEQDAQTVEKFKQVAVKSAVFAPALPIVCASIGIKESDISLVCEGMQAGLIPPDALMDWTMGGVLAKLPSSAVKPLFDQMFMMDSQAYSVALDLMGMYVHGNANRLEELRSQLKLAASRVDRRPKTHGSQMDAHHFEELMGWILAKGREDADARIIAMTLAKHLVTEPDGGEEDLIKPLMPAMLSGFGSIVWPVFGQAIVSDPAKSWRIEHALGDSFSFADVKKPAILRLPEDILFAWCHAYPDIGPAFVAAIAPVLTTQDPNATERAFHPVVKRLLDEFGDRDTVLRKLVQNMHTFGWTGSRTTYYALYEQPLRTLEAHHIGAVRRWAKRMLSELGRQIEAAHNEDEEEKAHWDI